MYYFCASLYLTLHWSEIISKQKLKIDTAELLFSSALTRSMQTLIMKGRNVIAIDHIAYLIVFYHPFMKLYGLTA